MVQASNIEEPGNSDSNVLKTNQNRKNEEAQGLKRKKWVHIKIHIEGIEYETKQAVKNVTD